MSKTTKKRVPIADHGHKRSIMEIAKVIRSKNSGPYELTLDIIFRSSEDYEMCKSREVVNPALISKLYKIPETDILGIIWFEPAHAVKITIKRWIPSGDPGETDIYGAQQHAPLLGIEFDA
ncbi:MAG TPA: DUF4387 domain-containing protein [Candidatus Ozemobacteraceae bacterium]|nr:DUF4387 domain-containing protein [Candidatus Ozemobacteraceae bacterium]